LPAGHRGQHRRSAAERKAVQVARDARFYYANQRQRIEYARKRRRTVKRSMLQVVLKNIESVEKSWLLRLDGKIRRSDWGIVDKLLTHEDRERASVELRRCKDRRHRAPVTAFLRLPRITP
jgi:hypothetical protein